MIVQVTQTKEGRGGVCVKREQGWRRRREYTSWILCLHLFKSCYVECGIEVSSNKELVGIIRYTVIRHLLIQTEY